MTDRQFNDAFLPLYKPMYGVAVSILADREAAADAVQDAMLSLWDKRNEIDMPRSAKAYALIAVRNKCLSAMRAGRSASQRESTTASGLLPDIEADSRADDRAALTTSQQLVASAIDSLSDRIAEVMRLALFGECSNSEIEEITGLSPANVRQCLSRGRKELREILTKLL